jgi:hypothetical protein
LSLQSTKNPQFGKDLPSSGNNSELSEQDSSKELVSISSLSIQAKSHCLESKRNFPPGVTHQVVSVEAETISSPINTTSEMVTSLNSCQADQFTEKISLARAVSHLDILSLQERVIIRRKKKQQQ